MARGQGELTAADRGGLIQEAAADVRTAGWGDRRRLTSLALKGGRERRLDR